MVKSKGYNSFFNSWIDKKRDTINETKSFIGRVKVELDLLNYATKAGLKNARGVDTWKFAKKVDLANLKSQVDK